MKPNILICGKTGAGKTTLLQTVTQPGTVPDEAIGHGAPTTYGVIEYETEIANFMDCEGMEPGQTIQEYVDFIMNALADRQCSANDAGVVHSIWYCLDGSGGRVQSGDANILRKLPDNTLVVVTKVELLRKEQMTALLDKLLELVPMERIIMVSSHSERGLTNLLAKAEAMAEIAIQDPDFYWRWDEYYQLMKKRWKKRMDEDAQSYITWGAGRAAAIALIPLPLADVGPLVANEAYMIYRLGTVYGYAVNKSILTILAGVAGGSFAGKLTASFLPFMKIPIAAGITYGVGVAAKAYFESGMTMDRDELKQKFLEGEKESKKTDWKECKIHED